MQKLLSFVVVKFNILFVHLAIHCESSTVTAISRILHTAGLPRTKHHVVSRSFSPSHRVYPVSMIFWSYPVSVDSVEHSLAPLWSNDHQVSFPRARTIRGALYLWCLKLSCQDELASFVYLRF